MSHREQRKRRRRERQKVVSISGEKQATVQLARRQAESFIRGLQKEFPQKSLIQLLPYVARHNPLAGEMLVERIKLNQGDRLSIDDLVFLKQIKAQLAEQKDCPVGA